jgi:hypothetical protein
MNNLNDTKKFGMTISFVLFSAAIYNFYYSGFNLTGTSFFLLSALFLIATILNMKLLSQVKTIWLKLGDLLGKITSPIILGVIFCILITPVSIITRLLGRDQLRLKKSGNSSYWQNRKDHTSISISFKNQF